MLIFSSDFQLALVSFGMLQSNSLFSCEILDGFGVYQRVLAGFGSVLFQRPVRFFFNWYISILAGSDV
jgi:hypothetical protein